MQLPYEHVHVFGSVGGYIGHLPHSEVLHLELYSDWSAGGALTLSGVFP